MAAVAAINNGAGPGVWAQSEKSNARMAAIHAINNGDGRGIFAKSAKNNAIRGETGSIAAAVAAINNGTGPGVWAQSGLGDLPASDRINASKAAVAAMNIGDGRGVFAKSAKNNAIHGETGSGVAAIAAINTGAGPGVWAQSGPCVWPESDKIKAGKAAVAAMNDGDGQGVYAKSAKNNAIHGETGSGVAAIAAINTGTGPGIWAESANVAGHFQGNVEVTGDIILTNADCAEDFEISAAEQVNAGTVMALNDAGQLEPVKKPYDKRVAGVISGAGDLKPALILGRLQGQKDKLPIALMGRVNCRVDADYGPIEVGDLLTTSATVGHAMKASDPVRSFGAVIGKALRPLKKGRDLIPILVALQ